jgi:hypothetical protein
LRRKEQTGSIVALEVWTYVTRRREAEENTKFGASKIIRVLKTMRMRLVAICSMHGEIRNAYMRDFRFPPRCR